jgi:hypothetical protein
MLFRHNLILFVGLLVAFTSCRSDSIGPDTLPYVFVNESVFLNSLEAQPLTQRDGAFIYISGGLKGIIVYRQAQGLYTAIERQSPGKGNCSVRVDITQAYISDSCAGAQFNFEGELTSGYTPSNLRRYSVSADNNRIIITN